RGNLAAPSGTPESMRGIEVVIETALTVTRDEPRRMRTRVVSAPAGLKHDFLHVDLQIANRPRANESPRGRAGRRVDRDRAIAGILQRLKLRPVFEAQSFELRLHYLRRIGETARGI